MSVYASHAQNIFDSGLGNPLPVSPSHKGPLVAGWHGLKGGWMEQADVDKLTKKFSTGKVNIGIRIDRNLVGIDVDAHSGKKGAESFTELLERYGPLPHTWVSTARDLPSGIHMFRIDDKLANSDIPSSIAGMPDIDLVNYGDMYVMCAPSRHPKIDKLYRWIHTGTGEVTYKVPQYEDIPPLPVEWQEAIMGEQKEQRPSQTTGFAAAAPATVTVIATSDEDAFSYAKGVLRGKEELRGEHASRHKAVAAVVLRLTFSERDDLIAKLSKVWDKTMVDERGKKEAAREWNNIVRSAVGYTEKPADKKRPPGAGKVKPPKGTKKVKTKDKSFPLHALPDPMRRYAIEVMRSKQVPAGLVAPSMIAALSAATAGGVVVTAPDGYEYGTAVYFMGVANPSERKSSNLNQIITKPLQAAFDTLAAGTLDERNAADAQVIVMAKNLKKMEKDSDESAVIGDAINLLAEAEEDAALLVAPNFIVSDPTPEALERMMASQHGVGMVSSAEGAFIENLGGRYGSDSPSLAMVNDAWSRGKIRTLRIRREEVSIPVAHLVIAALVQGTIAEGLAGAKFEDTGFLSRMFFTAPPSQVGTRSALVPHMDKAWEQWWENVLTAILTRCWGRIAAPDKMHLTKSATQVWVEWFNICEARANDPKAIQGWWSKAAEMAVRVAALTTLSADPEAEKISAVAMANGVEIVTFFAEEQSRFYLDVIDPFVGVAADKLRRRVMKRLATHYGVGDEFTTREVYKALHTSRYPVTADDVNPVLAYIAETEGTIEEEQVRRVDSTKWKVVGEKNFPHSRTGGTKRGSDEPIRPKDIQRVGEVGEITYGVEDLIHTPPPESSTGDFTASAPLSHTAHREVPPVPTVAVWGEDLTWEWQGEEFPIHLYAPQRRDEFMAFMTANLNIGFDTETTGLRTFSGDTVRTAQFGNADEAWVLRADEHHEEIVQALNIAQNLAAHNAGFDLLMTAEHLEVSYEALRRKMHDTSIYAHLLDPRGRQDGGVGHGLKALSDEHLGEGAADADKEMREIAKSLKIKVNDRFRGIPIDNAAYLRYAGADAILVYRLGKLLAKRLKKTDIAHYPALIPEGTEVTETIREVVERETRIARVAWDMKRRGIKVDREAADTLHDELIARETKAMKKLAKHGIDSPNKNAQVADALIAEGKYELTAQTPTGAWSVTKHVLDMAALQGSKVAGWVNEAKKVKRYRTVYVDGLLDFTDDNDMLHPDIRALRAVTGRMSISDPPLQQIPTDLTAVRGLFIPSKKSYRIVSADFSQIEARVLAALAGDEAFYEAVVHGDKAEGTDIHSVVARQAFGDAFTDADRDVAKRIVFGKLYGGGVDTLSRQSGVKRVAVSAIIDSFNTQFKGVKAYGQTLEGRAKRGEGFYLPSGRLALFGPNGEYKALNYMIQGTARDLFVDAVLRLEDAGYGDNLLLPIHDEVLMEVPAKGIKAAVADIAEIMSTTFGGVSMPVGVGYGKSWGTANH